MLYKEWRGPNRAIKAGVDLDPDKAKTLRENPQDKAPKCNPHQTIMTPTLNLSTKIINTISPRITTFHSIKIETEMII